VVSPVSLLPSGEKGAGDRIPQLHCEDSSQSAAAVTSNHEIWNYSWTLQKGVGYFTYAIDGGSN